MKNEFLIGADGTIWPHIGRLSTPQCDTLISGEGFIRVAVDDDSMFIRLNADVVSEKAVGQLLFDVLDRRQRPVELSWFDNGWHTSVFAEQSGFVRKLNELTVPTAEGYRVSAQAFATLCDDNPFAPLVAKWREESGAGDVAGYLGMFPKTLRNRFFVLDLAADKHRLTFDRVGFGFPLLSDEWAAQCAGAPIEEQADYAYACAVARAYRQVGCSLEPLWEHVEAAIDVPGRGPTPVRYQRLIMPVCGAGEQVKLLGTTFLDPNVSIPSGSQ